MSHKLRGLSECVGETDFEASLLTMRGRTSIRGWRQTADFAPAKEGNLVIRPIIKSDISDLKKDFQRIVDMISELQGKPLIYTANLRDLESKKYKLRNPIEIIIEKYEDEVVARFPELELFGSAETESEAIRELKREIITLHVELVSSKEDELGPLPQMWRRILGKLISQ